ncbi:hypothetical protein [Longivirga aurantiaca]|uniref:Uncharacterized protein n=1 Tax=Longivirga aurantiaca TaxID=1837743 RepID=A0ABW1SWF3_9ACTN
MVGHGASSRSGWWLPRPYDRRPAAAVPGAQTRREPLPWSVAQAADKALEGRGQDRALARGAPRLLLDRGGGDVG